MFTIRLNKYTYHELTNAQKTFIGANYDLVNWTNIEYYRTKIKYGAGSGAYLFYVVYTFNDIRYLRNFSLDETDKKYELANFFNNELVQVSYVLDLTIDDTYVEKKLPTEFIKQENSNQNQHIYTMIVNPTTI